MASRSSAAFDSGLRHRGGPATASSGGGQVRTGPGTAAVSTADSTRAWRVAVATAVVEDYKRRTADDARYNKIKVSLYGSAFYLAIGTLLFGLEMEIDAFDALYFSYCTLTTIGYGDFSPGGSSVNRTEVIVIFIVYSLLGLGVVANLIATVIDYLEYKNERFHEARAAARARSQTEAAEEAAAAATNDERVAASAGLRGARMLTDEEILQGNAMHSVWNAVKAAIYLGVWLFVGGFLFHHSEGWKYFDGVYFAYETLSTIGFGDQSSLYVENETSPEYLSNVQVTGKACVEHKGACTWEPCGEFFGTSKDGQLLFRCLEEKKELTGGCSCVLSAAAKAIVMVYSLFSFGVLANLLASISHMVQLLLARSKGVKKNDVTNDHIKRAQRKSFRGRCPCLARWWTTFRSLVLIALSIVYIFFGAAVFIELDPNNFVDPDDPQHALYAASYFCVITLTTIGYGDFSPTTTAAKTFFIFYGLAGLVLFGFLLTTLKQLLRLSMAPLVKAIKMVCTKFNRFADKFEASIEESVEPGADRIDEDDVDKAILELGAAYKRLEGHRIVRLRNLQAVSIVSLIYLAVAVAVMYILDHATVPSTSEKAVNGTEDLGFHLMAADDEETPLDILYFFIVTTSTIGYGDMYPREDHSRIFTSFIAYIGLVIIALFLDAYSQYNTAAEDLRIKLLQQSEADQSGMTKLVDLLNTQEIAHVVHQHHHHYEAAHHPTKGPVPIGAAKPGTSGASGHAAGGQELEASHPLEKAKTRLEAIEAKVAREVAEALAEEGKAQKQAQRKWKTAHLLNEFHAINDKLADAREANDKMAVAKYEKRAATLHAEHLAAQARDEWSEAEDDKVLADRKKAIEAKYAAERATARAQVVQLAGSDELLETKTGAGGSNHGGNNRVNDSGDSNNEDVQLQIMLASNPAYTYEREESSDIDSD